VIGVFDSGVGGLTVVRQLLKYFNSDIVYLGDTARLPYGIKSKDTVVKYSIQNAKFLENKNIDALVVACNTASSSAIEILKEELSIPVFGVIEPAAKKASKHKNICVLGTESTISSNAYVKKIRKYNNSCKIKQIACPLFVPLVESGWVDNEITYMVAKKYLSGDNSDVVILGCTHYPLLKGVIQDVLPNAELVDSGEALVESLSKYGELFSGRGVLECYTTDSKEKFSELGKLFLGKSFNGVKLTDLS